MTRNANGRPAATTQRNAPDDPNDPNDPNNFNGSEVTTLTTRECTISAPHTVRHTSSTSADIVRAFDEWDDAPLIPLWLLLLTDATPAEIASRLRLNFAIPSLLHPIPETHVP